MNQQRMDRTEFYLVMTGVLFAPFSAFRPPNLFFTLSDFFFLLACLMHFRRINTRSLGSATSLWLLGVGLMLGGLFISSLLNGATLRGDIVMSQYFFAFVCLPIILLNRSYDDTVLLIKCCVWSMFLLCASGLIIYWLGISNAGTRHFMLVSGTGRLASFVDNPNGLAGIIVLALPLIWFLALIKEHSAKLTIFLFVVQFTALVLTSSNSGLIGATISAGIFLLGLRRIKLLLATAGVIGIGTFVVATWGTIFLPVTFQKRVLEAASSGDLSQAGTFDVRVELIQEAWDMLENNLFIGLGADQYRTISAHGLPVHNVYLLLANEGGLIALIGFVVILVAALLAVWIPRRYPHRFYVILTTLAIVVAFASIGMSRSHMYARFTLIPLLLAMSFAFCRWQEVKQEFPFVQGRRPTHAAAPSAAYY